MAFLHNATLPSGFSSVLDTRWKVVIELKQSQNIANGSRAVVGVNSKSNERDLSDQFREK